jgi:hypothetical protein
MTLTDEQVEQLAQRTSKLIIEKKRDLWVDPETHYEDHLFLRDYRKESASAKRRYEKLRDIVLGAVLSALALAVMAVLLSNIGDIAKLLGH